MKFQAVTYSLFIISIIAFGASPQSYAQTFTVENGATVSVQNSGTLDLGTTTTLAENNGQVTGNGQVRAVRTLNAPSSQDIAGLGAIITSGENLGQTTVIRSHTEQSVGNQKSVKRYYEITPSINTGLDATLVFNYADADVNDLPEDDLTLFRSDDGGSTYNTAGYTTRDASSNTITLNEIDSFAQFSAAAPGLYNYGSLDLNGVDHYMDISSISDDLSGTNTFSVSFWVKPDFANQTDGSGVAPFGLNDAAGNDLLNIFIGAPGSQDQVVRLFDSNGLPIINGPELTDDTWHHIAFTYDNGSTTLYVDGRSEGQSTTSVTLSSDDQWSIGQEFDSGSESDLIDGTMNDVRVWNQVRNGDQIRNNMFQPLKGDETDLVGYWALNNVNNDFSLNSNDATLVNNPPFISGKQPAGAFITGSEGWRILTAPAGGETYNQILEELWIQGVEGSDAPNNGTPNLYSWDEPNQQFSVVNGTNIPAAGQGFLVYVYDDQDYDGTGEGFPKMLRGATDSRTGNVSPTLEYTAGGTADSTGWNLVGNPYGATIDWDASGWSTANLDASFYVWSDSANGGTGDYLSWNGMAGTLGDGLIAPWQGFWVKGNASGPEITFTDEIRSAGGVLLKSQSVPQLNFSIIGADSDSMPALQSQAVVMFDEQASEEKDDLDAYKLQSLNTEYLSLFTQLQNGSGLDINALPDDLEESISVPIGINGSDLSGNFELSWSTESLPEDWNFILRDAETGNEFNLREHSSFSFELSENSQNKAAGNDKKQEELNPVHQVVQPKVLKRKDTEKARLTMIISSGQAVTNERLSDVPAQVELQQNYPNPFNPTTTIEYGVPEKSVVTMEVFNMLGQKVATLINQEAKSAGSYSVQFDASRMASGLYLYRLKAGDTVITKKLTLIK